MLDKKLSFGFLVFFLLACQTPNASFVYEEDLPACDSSFQAIENTVIPIQQLLIPYSEVLTNEKNFILSCLGQPPAPLVLGQSDLPQHHLIFEFASILPIRTLEVMQAIQPSLAVAEINIEFSTNGVTYTSVKRNVKLLDDVTTVETQDLYAKRVRITFLANAEYSSFQDIRFRLGAGFVTEVDDEYTSYFLRTSGWTGADGIFSYDLDQGGDEIGQPHQTSGFVFSDTFVGNVDPVTYRRQTPVTLINNSFGYLNHQVPLTAEAFSFAYDQAGATPLSPVLPDAFIGHQPRNLFDSDGFLFSHSPEGKLTNTDTGVGWLTDQLDASLLIDLWQPQTVEKLYLWNYNANPNQGVQSFRLEQGNDTNDFTEIGTYSLPKASGNFSEPYTLMIDLNDFHHRYLRLHVLNTYDPQIVGLSKLLLVGSDNRLVFGKIDGPGLTTAVTDGTTKPRLWLQDGLILEQQLINFPLLIKNANGFFSVNSVGMVTMPIVNNRFDYAQASYQSTPLMTRSPDNGVITFGAGVMDNRPRDGYIYVYGYKDLRGRNLVAARFLESQVNDFNAWQFYGLQGWQADIHLVKPLQNEVSAELSVTYLPVGMHAGKYMLTVMKNTVSGSVAYALGDSPVGPFTSFQTIYQTLEHTQFKSGFTYNAKLHPNLSTNEKWFVSYNVNSNDLATLMDARVYYPRFLSLRPIQSL